MVVLVADDGSTVSSTICLIYTNHVNSCGSSGSTDDGSTVSSTICLIYTNHVNSCGSSGS